MSEPGNKDDRPKKGFLKKAFQGAKGSVSRFIRKLRKPGLDRALVFAAHIGDEKEVLSLIKAGADPRTQEGLPMREAAAYGHIETVRILLAAGIAANENGSRAFIAAVAGGHRDSARLLLQKDADVNAQDGEAVVSCAARNGLRMMELLVLWKADVNVRGGQPLQEAAAHGHQHMVQFLLQSGAKVSGADDLALLLARENGWRRCEEVILEHLATQTPPPSPPAPKTQGPAP